MKIVTNIYLITAFETFSQIKKDWDNSNYNVDVDDFYQKNLKKIRKKVYKFFGVDEKQEVNVKYLVRLYPYLLSERNPIHSEYMFQSEKINLLLENLKNRIFPKKFMDVEKIEIIDVIMF